MCYSKRTFFVPFFVLSFVMQSTTYCSGCGFQEEEEGEGEMEVRADERRAEILDERVEARVEARVEGEEYKDDDLVGAEGERPEEREARE
jgi:hypothetical protein